jgi:hypothetical protein
MNYCDICNERKAKICIQIYGRNEINMVYSCKSCAKLFSDPLCSCKQCGNSKKMLERAVEPEYSNTRSDFNSMGVPLDD